MSNPYDDLLDAAPQPPTATPAATVPPPAAPVAAPRGKPAANPYLDLIPDHTGQAALTVGLSSDRNASAAAADMALAKKYNTTPQVVAAFPDDFRQRAQMELARDALAKAPALSRAIVNNPALAAAAHPEVPQLSLVNQAVDALGKAARYVTGADSGRSAGQDLLAIGGAASRAVSPVFEKVFMAAGGLASLADSTDKNGVRSPNILSDAAFRAVDFFKEAGTANAPGAGAGLWDKALDMTGQTGGVVMEALATGGEAPVARAGASLWSALGGMASHGVRSMMVPATLASDKTFADVIENGGTTAEATKAASAAYLTTTLGGVLPMATPGKLAFRLGAGALSGLTQGNVNRQIMNAALPDSMQQPEPTTDDRILEALAGAVFGGLTGPHDAAAMQRHATEVARRTYVDAAQVEHAKQGADAVAKISELAANSDLRKNAPDAFKQLVRDMTDGAGTPELYVDAKHLAAAMDTAGLDAAFMQEHMPAVAGQMREGLQSEGMVRIPIEDYATHLAGTPADAALQPHLRIDPEGKTFGEAQKAQTADAAKFQAEAEKVLTKHEKDSAFRASAQEVHDDILGQLKTVNRFPADVNKAYAAMTRDFYTTLADRLGMTPKEALDRYPLQVRSEALPGGGAAFDQGGQRAFDKITATLHPDEIGSKDARRPAFFAEQTLNQDAMLEPPERAQARLIRKRAGRVADQAKQAEMLRHADELDRAAEAKEAEAAKMPESTGGTAARPAGSMHRAPGPHNSTRIDQYAGALDADGLPSDREAIKVLSAARGNPEALVTVYRAAPVGSSLRAGDWVSPTRQYAEMHAEAVSGEAAFNIIEQRVRAADLYTDGNSVNELGYQPALDQEATYQQSAKFSEDNRLSNLRARLAELRTKAKELGVVLGTRSRGGESADKRALRAEYAAASDAFAVAETAAVTQRTPHADSRPAPPRSLLDADLPAVPPGSTRLFHSSSDNGLKRIDPEDGNFGGLFAGVSRESASGPGAAPFMYYLDVPSDRVASAGDMARAEREMTPTQNAAIDKAIRERSGPTISADEVSAISEAAFSDTNEADGVSPSRLVKLARTEYQIPEHASSWAIQMYRGMVAKALGFDAVAMSDEHGTSYLVVGDNITPNKAFAEQTLAQDATYQQSAKFSEDNRLSNLRMDGPSWDRIRAENPALKNTRSAEDEVTIYRATIGDSIRPDDYVAASKATLKKELANVKARDGKGAKIVELKVPVGDLLLGNDATEFVYSPRAGAARDPGRAEFGQPKGWGSVAADPEAAAEALKPRAGSLGKISFANDITQHPSVITLFEKANLTTFLHESGHFFLEVYSDVASRADAPPVIVKDMGALLDWFGMKTEGDPLATWRAMPADAKREFHEKFARGFEAYLMEGKAPTPGLQGLFSRFSSWMVQTYRTLAGLHVNLTPEVRGVMDRMLASEETIRQSEDASGMLPLFTEKPPGMDAEAYARYQALGQSATDGAVADLQHRGARDMKWLSGAQSEALKAEQAKAETARAAIRDEVTREVDAHPAFQAKAFLDDKANKGADPDFVADQFGYSSGEEMVQAISDVGSRADAIATMTDQRMLAEHGDLVDERAVAKAASGAIHNDVRLRFLATELRTLAQATGSARATAQAAKQAAEASVSAKMVRDLRPGQYEAAGARAGKASAEAFKAGDMQTAAVQKRAQILSHALGKAAGEAQAEAEKAVKYLKKFDKEGVRKALPADYLVQIDALLEKHDLRQTSMKAADEVRSLRAWVQSRLNAGEIPPLSENLLSPKERKAYQDQISIRDENGNLVFADPEEQIKLLADAIENGARTSHIDLTVEALRGLRDTVRTIEHMGRQAGKILTAEENATYQGVRDEIVASLEQHATRSGLGDRTSNTRTGEMAQGIKQFMVSHLRPATWAQIMDGGESNGALWKYLIKPANERMSHETTRKAQATEALAAVLSPILKDVSLRDKAGSGKYFKELGTSLNWQERFAFLLNYGNESNLQRLKDGGIAGVSKALTDAQIQTVLRTMTAAELRAAQAVWDHLETYRPEIGALERKMTGKEPEWIQPRPFSVRSVDGELVHLEGGYYPVVFDPRGSLQAQQHAQAQEAKTLSRAAYSAATTSRSFTKQRVDEVVGRPLMLNLSGLYRGVNDVIHDLSFREWTVDANKLLRSKTIDASIRDHYGPEVKRTMEKWRDDLVAGTRNLDHGVEQASSFARRHVSMAGLSFNMMSAAIQPLGITQSMARIGVKWTAKGIAEYVARRGELTQEVHAQSEFMRNRGSTAFRELAELGAQVKGQTKWGEFRDSYAFWLTAASQGLVDVPTWKGAHMKALAEGFDDATAVHLADQAVKDSQGGGEKVDLSGIERGPAVTKLFTVFYSFMNTALNTGALATVHASGKADLAIKLALTAVIPTVLGRVFRDAATPGDSGSYDDWEKTAKTLISEQAQFMLGMVAFAREFSGVAHTLTGDKDLGYSGPTGLRMIPDAGKLAKQAMQGQFDTAFRKALINFMGDVFGIPSAQINKTWTGMEAMANGDTDNPMALIAGYQKPN